MNLKKNIMAVFASLALSCAACAGPVSQNLSAAAEHSMVASGHGSGTLLQGASAVASVPLLVVGSAGVVIGSAGSAMAEFASEPLPLGEVADHDAQSTPRTPDPATVLGRQDRQ